MDIVHKVIAILLVLFASAWIYIIWVGTVCEDAHPNSASEQQECIAHSYWREDHVE